MGTDNIFLNATIFNKGAFLGQAFKHARMTSGSNAEMTSMYSSLVVAVFTKTKY